MTVIASRDNPRLRRWIRLATDARERRRAGRAIIEGPNLVAAYLDSGRVPEALIVSKSAASLARGSAATVISDRLFAALADADTPQGIAAEIALPGSTNALGSLPACVFLDSIQDAGNVGAILRSAAAFGIPAAVLGSGCADAWSPKVLRAAAGAHFSLDVRSMKLEQALEEFGGRVACTVPRGGVPLAEVDLSGRIGWIFGAEGQGVSVALGSRATLRVTIPMQPGTESLNVAAAAAICFYRGHVGPGR